MSDVVITGTGLVTPLGDTAGQIVDRIARGESAVRPAPFAGQLACRHFAPVADFDAQSCFPDNKTLRLMNRDAQMAVVAARRALADAGLAAEVPSAGGPPERALYRPGEIALYGATGLSGLPGEEIGGLVRHAAARDGSLDLASFGAVALKRIRPVLSFKILANMPICFVSIFENLRGPNGVYAPWEGQGACAIAAGVRAIRRGEVPCAVVGGCDVKTHAMSLVSLEQLGVFESWTRRGAGCVPGEGAAFLVLEERRHAADRGARIYAAVAGYRQASLSGGDGAPALAAVLPETFRPLNTGRCQAVVAAADGAPEVFEAEEQALDQAGCGNIERVSPKRHLGDLFAAAAAVQVAVAAEKARRLGSGACVLANCLGFGAEKASFLLEAA